MHSTAQTQKSWHSCPRRMNAGNKNTPSMHHPQRRNVTTSMVGIKKKWSHTQKSHTKWWTPEIQLGKAEETIPITHAYKTCSHLHDIVSNWQQFGLHHATLQHNHLYKFELSQNPATTNAEQGYSEWWQTVKFSSVYHHTKFERHQFIILWTHANGTATRHKIIQVRFSPLNIDFVNSVSASTKEQFVQVTKFHPNWQRNLSEREHKRCSFLKPLWPWLMVKTN